MLSPHAQNQPLWPLLSYRTREAFPRIDIGRLGFGVRSERVEEGEEEGKEISHGAEVYSFDMYKICCI